MNKNTYIHEQSKAEYIHYITYHYSKYHYIKITYIY